MFIIFDIKDLKKKKKKIDQTGHGNFGLVLIHFYTNIGCNTNN